MVGDRLYIVGGSIAREEEIGGLDVKVHDHKPQQDSGARCVHTHRGNL